MTIREAKMEDIQEIMDVRFSVKENILSNPEEVTGKDCEDFLFNRGKGWVCEAEGRMAGFAIADLEDNNIWALFLRPEFERQGIGRALHDTMLDWYFTQTQDTVWLGTTPGTRAEQFYRTAGWVEVGVHGKGEIKFEMTSEAWKKRQEMAKN